MGSIFSFPFPPTAYEGGRVQGLSPTLMPTAWLTHIPTNRSALAVAQVRCRASSPTYYRRRGAGEGGGHLSFSHSTIWQMKGGDASPMCIRGIRSPVPCPWHQLYRAARERGGAHSREGLDELFHCPICSRRQGVRGYPSLAHTTA